MTQRGYTIDIKTSFCENVTDKEGIPCSRYIVEFPWWSLDLYSKQRLLICNYRCRNFSCNKL